MEKDVFRLVTSVGHTKNSESPSGIDPKTFEFRAPMLYHLADRERGLLRQNFFLRLTLVTSIFLHFFTELITYHFFNSIYNRNNIQTLMNGTSALTSA